jgi:hypothetical protein
MSEQMVTANRFLDEPLTIERVKLEAVLAVAFEARPCALVNIPADLPEGEKLAAEVEQSCRDAYLEARNEGDRQRKLELVKAFTQDRRSAFARIVVSSPAFLALSSWSKEFGLTARSSEVLPTTWELYLFKGLRTRMHIRRLTAMRTQIRRQDRRPINSENHPMLFAEEFSPGYVRQVGEALGYPPCCIERFVQDRANHVTAEDRASEQIRSFRAEGKEIDLSAYYLKDFFPCSPICQEAGTRGQKMHKVLSQISPEVGERYRRLLETNLSLVERFPDIVRMHREKLQSLRQ